MIVASKQSDVVAPAGSSVGPRVYRHATAVLLQLLMAALCLVNAPSGLQAAEAPHTSSPMEERVRALLPDLEAYIARGMQAFDVPGLAIGVTDCNRNQPGLQSARFQDHINCIYHPAQDHINCN